MLRKLICSAALLGACAPVKRVTTEQDVREDTGNSAGRPTSGEADGFYIYNGTADGAGNDKSIFMTSAEMPGGNVNLGSASNVLYKRCLLTAGHTVSDGTMMVYQGQALGPDVGRQRIARKAVLSTALYRDLALLWVEARQDDFPISEYSQLTMIDDIGLSHVAFEDYPSPLRQSAGGPKSVTYIGYGRTGANDPLEGAGVRRTGAGEARWYSIGTMETPAKSGSVYHFKPLQPAGAPGLQRTCAGDSGGPVLKDSKLFAVVKGDVKIDVGQPACGPDGYVHATGLNKQAPTGSESNWDWVHRQARITCAKHVTVDRVGPGKVSGTTTPTASPAYPNDEAINGALKCSISLQQNQSPPTQGWTDCTEAIHDGESITLQAVPDANSVFVRWENLAYPLSAGCRCHLSTSPTCAYTYDTIGYYSATASLDLASCRAIFQASPSGPPGPPGPR